MELFLRIIFSLLAFLSVIVNAVLNWCLPRKKPTYPPIRNKLLTLSVGELLTDLRSKKITSQELVQAYIGRIEEVNPCLNAVVEQRFEEALKEAKHADELISKCNSEQLNALFARHPLLGIPFTVKESCGVKDMSFTVGNIHRKGHKSPNNGEVVQLLRSAGCIPLVVTANPEFCLSYETYSHTNGRCHNSYDLRRAASGSSGGEGALNGSGATLFGLGSDIGGSIRLPAMFNGVFGHKPTGGLVSIRGHFPNNDVDDEFPDYLQLGPITRFARDMPMLLQIMAGKNAVKLNFADGVNTKDIKIYYAYGFDGLNGFLHPPVAFDIKLAVLRAVKCFEKGGLKTEELKLKNLRNSLEISINGLTEMEGVPSIIENPTKKTSPAKDLTKELLRCFYGRSLYTKEALLMELAIALNGLISPEKQEKYRDEKEVIREELINLLGTNGVLLFPTFHTPAFISNTSVFNISGCDVLMLFNILGFPSTQVPMGLNQHGLPIGIQVIAAPYQDKLTLHIAAELESAFGGWIPPIPNEI